MSLLHRTSSIESFTRRRSSTASPPQSPFTSAQQGGPILRDPTTLYYDTVESAHNSSRKLSYNPVGQWIPQKAHEPPIGAYEVPRARRIGQVIVAAVYSLLGAGIVFGYAALKPVLIQEGVYRDQCSKQEVKHGVEVCYGQELRLNFMFTAAAVVTNVSALPVGAVLDRFGPRLCASVGALFIALGCGFLAAAAEVTFDAYLLGYLFLALGGPFIFISSFQLSNAFPRSSGLILALLTGAFDTSSAIFLFYRLAYEQTKGWLTPKKFFLVYLIVPVFILTAQILLMPKASYKTIGELVTEAEQSADADDAAFAREHAGNEREANQLRQASGAHRESVVDEITSLLGTPDATEPAEREEKHHQASGVSGALHGLPAWRQILSPWWILITAFTALQMTRINYFVATIRPQYAYLLRSTEKAVQINRFFDVALPLGGVVSVPFIGFILDNRSTVFVLGLLVTIATSIGVLGLIPQMWAAYGNVILFVLYRPLYYTSVSDYAAKVFGFETFGRVYGLIICVAGLFNFVQSALDYATYKRFDGNPTPINVILLVAALSVGVILVTYVGLRARSIRREILEREAEAAIGSEREHLVPGTDAEVMRQDRHPIDVHSGERPRRRWEGAVTGDEFS